MTVHRIVFQMLIASEEDSVLEFFVPTENNPKLLLNLSDGLIPFQW